MRVISIIRMLIEVAYSFIVTYAIGKWAFYYAYMERGYEAMGGEYLLIPVTFYLAYKIIHFLFDVLEETRHARGRNKRRSRKPVRVQNN